MSKKVKKLKAKIVLVYCPRCRMLFYDLWKERDFWRELNDLTYICPYCHAELHTDLGWTPP